jgi:O-antigen biosynthesis protein
VSAAPGTGAPLVDVVVPVYGARATTLRCIASVLGATVRTPYELVVVDDDGPDPELAAALDALAGSGRLTLVRNERNLGFVRSANQGMRLHPGRDVVLLNSDAEVFGDWLDRLRAAAARDRVATVTPFSNNGEICSYPRFMTNNRDALELSDAELDALAAETNRGAILQLPTAVGFCMYVTRACLDVIGFFDEEHFGAGYGEENDFSVRAEHAGWRNVLAADVFVRHHGGVSFGAAKAEHMAAGSEALRRLHPGFSANAERFIADDPVAPLRRRIDVARLRRRHGAATVLLLTNGGDDGADRHVGDEARGIAAGGGGVLVARGDGGPLLPVTSPELALPNLPAIDLRGEPSALAPALAALGVAELHVHRLAGLPPYAADFARVAAARAAVPYDVTLHDYLAICPRATLVDAAGTYCGEPEDGACERCAGRPGAAEPEPPPLWAWRERQERFLREARSVTVLDDDAARRLARYFPDLPVAVRAPADPEPGRAPADPEPGRSPDAAADYAGAPRAARGEREPGRRRVGVVGPLGTADGSRLLLRCARLARERELPLAFVVLGATDADEELAAAGVEVTGAHAPDRLDALLAGAGLDLVWFPAVWPRPYSYGLTAALRAGIAVVAFDLGGFATRLRAAGRGRLLSATAVFEPAAILEALLTVPLGAPPVPAAAAAQ